MMQAVALQTVVRHVHSPGQISMLVAIHMSMHEPAQAYDILCLLLLPGQG